MQFQSNRKSFPELRNRKPMGNSLPVAKSSTRLQIKQENSFNLLRSVRLAPISSPRHSQVPLGMRRRKMPNYKPQKFTVLNCVNH